MAFFTTEDGVRLFYRCEGPEAAPAIVLSNSLGTDHMMWQPQAEAFATNLRVVRYDQRGHGASDAPEGAYAIERLGRDVLALADHLQLARFSFCGLSMGGITGQWLAIHVGKRLDRLVLAATTAHFPDRKIWEDRIALVEEKGLGPLVEPTMERFFTANFRGAAPSVIDSFRRTFLATQPRGYLGCCHALRDVDFRAGLGGIDRPTLVIAGSSDPSTPLPMNQTLAEAIPGARLVVLEGNHIVSMEQAEAFTREAGAFLGQGTLPQDARFGKGIQRRRQVLGDAWVDASIAKRSSLNADFQDLLTRYCWGEVWTRPGLDEATRRLLVLAVTAAMGRWEEFDLHARAALTAGVPLDTVKETLLQIAIYAGVPTANTGFNRLGKLVEES